MAHPASSRTPRFVPIPEAEAAQTLVGLSDSKGPKAPVDPSVADEVVSVAYCKSPTHEGDPIAVAIAKSGKATYLYTQKQVGKAASRMDSDRLPVGPYSPASPTHEPVSPHKATGRVRSPPRSSPPPSDHPYAHTCPGAPKRPRNGAAVVRTGSLPPPERKFRRPQVTAAMQARFTLRMADAAQQFSQRRLDTIAETL